jgi:hypothetical protein
MTIAYLFFANVVLLGRLVVHFRDDAPSRRAWLLKGTIELAVLAACFRFSWPVAAAGATVAVFTGLALRGESRPGPRNFSRLLLGLLELIALSIWFAPSFGTDFRPGFAVAAAHLPEWTTLASLFAAVGGHSFHLFCFGLLLAANEANLAIRTVFDWLDLKPRKPAADGGLVDIGELNRGRIIGVLERALLYIFILQGQFGAIGFVLAAKAFTRFKALDDRSFAEYVLIGTLLSAGLALAIGALVRAF